MKKLIPWLIVFIAACVTYVTISTYIWMGHHPKDGNQPFYQKFETDLMQPDTAQIYWDRGVMYVMFKTTHTADTIVAEDDQ